MSDHKISPESSKTGNNNPEESKEISLAQKLWLIYPWLLLVGLLAIAVGVGIFSYYQLIAVDYVPQIQPEITVKTTTDQPKTKSPDVSNNTQIWLILAIALSCASGCFVIFRVIKFIRRI